MKPDPISLNTFLAANVEQFTEYELWLSDGLTEFLSAEKNLDPSHPTVIVDVEEEEPVKKVVDGKITIRYNGRFFIPKEDLDGLTFKEKPEDWSALIEKWFMANDIEVAMDKSATNMVKFTAFLDTLEIPEEKEEAAPSEAPPEEEPETAPEETAPTEEKSEETAPEEAEEKPEEKEEEKPEESAEKPGKEEKSLEETFDELTK